MKRNGSPGREPPVLLVKWYDLARWLLDRIDNFPKNQRFIFGTRLADHVLDVMELLVEASYSREKTELLGKINRKIETLRWLIRLAKDRKLLTSKQYQFCFKSLNECGRMTGGWLKSTGKERTPIETAQTPF